MKYFKLIMPIILLSLLFSCAATKTQVGNYNNTEGKTVVYEKGKDIYLFWDKIPLQKVEKKINIKDYEKIAKRNLFDNITYYGTMGIYSSYTVKIITKEHKNNKEGKFNP